MWKNDYTVGKHQPPKPSKHRRRFPPEVLTSAEVMALMMHAASTERRRFGTVR
jgi:hypothetical protein